MIVAAKIRGSTNKQDMESQRHVLQVWGDKNNHKLTFFEEFATSGRKELEGRENMQEMLQRCKAGEFEAVAVVELSRLGRTMQMISTIVSDLTKQGVKIIIANNNKIIDYESLEGRAFVGAMALAADIEWMLISERNRRGREKIKRDGIKVGRKRKEEKGLSIEAVKALREKGLSMRLIGKELGCSPATIMRILHSLESGHKTNIQQSKQMPNNTDPKSDGVSFSGVS